MLTDGVVTDRRRQEICRDQPGPLVDELIEGMLAVRSRFSPDDRARLIGHSVAVAVDALAVAFHVALLEVSGKAMHVLVVGKDDFGFGAEKVIVPDADERQDDRNIPFERSLSEMAVHLEGPLQQFFEVFEANSAGNGKPNGRPQRIPTANPVPEHKHVFPVNAERFNLFAVGGYGHKVPGDVAGIFRGLPGTSSEP